MIQKEGKIWIQICFLADALSSGFVLVAKVFRAIAISYPRRHAIVSDRFEILYCKDSPYVSYQQTQRKECGKQVCTVKLEASESAVSPKGLSVKRGRFH